MCFKRVPSTAAPVRSCDGGCQGEKKTQHPALMGFRPDLTHQCLRINLVKGCRQVRNHSSEGDVVTSVSAVAENIGEDSDELWYATGQIF